MIKKLAILMLVLLGMAFTCNVYAIEWDETGKVDIHGFISQGYLISDENNFYADTSKGGTSQFNEVGINFGTDVSDRLRLGVQLFARDLGKMGNNKLTVDWAFADYSFYDWLNLRAGRVKLPYGLYNTERDVDMLRTFVFLPQSIYNEGWRDSANALNGAGFYGYIPAGGAGSFSYQGYLGNTVIEPGSGVARLLESAMPTALNFDLEEANVDFCNAGTITWESIFGLDGLRMVAGAWQVQFDADVNVTGAAANIYSPGDTTTPIGQVAVPFPAVMNVNNFTKSFSIEYATGNLVLAAEIMQNSYDFFMAHPTNPAGNVDVDYDTLGYYGSATYRFTDWFEMGYYYSEYFSNDEYKDGENNPTNPHHEWLKDHCLTTRFDITSNWVFKLEGHVMNGAALLLNDDGNTDASGEPVYEEDWFLGAAKLSYSF